MFPDCLPVHSPHPRAWRAGPWAEQHWPRERPPEHESGFRWRSVASRSLTSSETDTLEVFWEIIYIFSGFKSSISHFHGIINSKKHSQPSSLTWFQQNSWFLHILFEFWKIQSQNICKVRHINLKPLKPPRIPSPTPSPQTLSKAYSPQAKVRPWR